MQIVYTFTNSKGAVLRSIVAIVLGLVLVVWPGGALRYIIMAVGTIFLITGLIAFVITNRRKEDRRKSFVPLSGIGSMALGLLLLCLPSTFATIFMFILGFFLIIAALGQFVTLGAIRRAGMFSPVSYLIPILILIAGVMVIFDPFESAKGVFILFGITAIFYGITDLLNQYSIKRVHKMNDYKERITRLDGNHEVEDAEYEEVKNN